MREYKIYHTYRHCIQLENSEEVLPQLTWNSFNTPAMDPPKNGIQQRGLNQNLAKLEKIVFDLMTVRADDPI